MFQNQSYSSIPVDVSYRFQLHIVWSVIHMYVITFTHLNYFYNQKVNELQKVYESIKFSELPKLFFILAINNINNRIQKSKNLLT